MESDQESNENEGKTLGERTLIDQCLKGDSTAWEKLFNLHYGPATRFVAQLGYRLEREDVEEICQETFLTVVENIGTFQGKSRFQTWLFRIAANKARDLIQRQRAVKRGSGVRPIPLHVESPDNRVMIDPPSPSPNPELSLIRAEDASVVGEAMEQLPEPNRIIIELRYFGNLSYDEIAKTLKLNPKTVSSRLSKSLDKLERLLLTIFKREPQGAMLADRLV